MTHPLLKKVLLLEPQIEEKLDEHLGIVVDALNQCLVSCAGLRADLTGKTIQPLPRKTAVCFWGVAWLRCPSVLFSFLKHSNPSRIDDSAIDLERTSHKSAPNNTWIWSNWAKNTTTTTPVFEGVFRRSFRRASNKPGGSFSSTKKEKRFLDLKNPTELFQQPLLRCSLVETPGP